MAKRGISVGVEITGSAKGYKAASEDAVKATANLEREARAKSRQIEQSFKMTTIAIAKIGAVLGVVRIAFGVFKTAMESTEGSADKFRESTDYAKGSLQGLFRTIATGNWESFISNIRLAAEATREMGKAVDDLEDKLAGDSITLGQWERKLQEARLVYAEFKESDPARAKAAIEDAITYQKAITSLTIQQLKERAGITEEYYRKLSNQDDKYFDYLIKQLPLIAQNQRMLLNPDYIAGLKKLDTHATRLMSFAIEDFIMLRDEMSKPGQFNEFIKSLGEIEAAAARGDQELVRLTAQLATLSKESKRISGPNKITGLVPPTVGIGFPTAPGLSGPPAQAIKEMTDAYSVQIEIVNRLQSTLEGMFFNAGAGFREMADVMIDSIKRIAAEIAAKAVIFALLKIIFPELFIGAELYKAGSFGKFITGGISAAPIAAGGTSKVNLSGNFKLAGNDMFLSVMRTSEIRSGST